ncbi:MAG: 16S rRNA (cytidine(1402)-2'-O)-methyltransferase [Calditrichota bacterium]
MANHKKKKKPIDQPENVSGGNLFLVSTPIGNLEDMTIRAKRILAEVDFILAEDTRTARFLLSQFTIKKTILSYYSYNEEKRIPQILTELKNGKNIALISEAGTPLISDPGYKLVVQAIQNRIPVIPVPGPSAIIAALVASGLPTDRFVFEGFLPRKKGRKTCLERLAKETGTIIIYESPLRIQKTIEDIVKILGNRYIVVAREITKKFEEFKRGFALDILKELGAQKIKGEIVLLVAGTRYQNPHSSEERKVIHE